jgi:hypothetical protein
MYTRLAITVVIKDEVLMKDRRNGRRKQQSFSLRSRVATSSAFLKIDTISGDTFLPIPQQRFEKQKTIADDQSSGNRSAYFECYTAAMS